MIRQLAEMTTDVKLCLKQGPDSWVVFDHLFKGFLAEVLLGFGVEF